MERITRHDPSEHAAILRLLLATAVSISLHGAAAWFLPGPVSSGGESTLRAHITVPFADSLEMPLRTAPHSESMPVPLLKSRRFLNGFASVETIDPTYYGVDEVDVFPAPLRPIGSAGIPVTGYVRVLVRIDASGRVTATGIFDSSVTFSEDNAAMLAISRTLFTAARKNGRNVRSEVVIELAAGL
jgi:TonB family protein